MTTARARRRCWRRRGSSRITDSRRRSSTAWSRARSRACTAARSSPIMPRPRAGRSRPTSTTTSSATAAARTACATPPMSACFPKGVRRDATPELVAQQRSLGGENDSPVAQPLALRRQPRRPAALGLDVRQIWRTDRFGRGGDHISFQQLGYPAVRFSVAIENYNWQHQDLRTENGIAYGDTIDHMDFPYLRRVTQLNIATIAALASAPDAAGADRWRGRCRPIRTLTWARPSRARRPIMVRWRRTDASQWEHSNRGAGTAITAALTRAASGSRSGSTTYQAVLAARPRRRLGVRRFLGRGGRVGKPGRIRGARRRVRALRAARQRPASQ